MRREKDIGLIVEAILICSEEMIACVERHKESRGHRLGGPEEFNPQSYTCI